jgi:hypothetical protein
MTLHGSVLVQHTACPALRHSMPLTHSTHTGSATFRA